MMIKSPKNKLCSQDPLVLMRSSGDHCVKVVSKRSKLEMS